MSKIKTLDFEINPGRFRDKFYGIFRKPVFYRPDIKSCVLIVYQLTDLLYKRIVIAHHGFCVFALGSGRFADYSRSAVFPQCELDDRLEIRAEKCIGKGQVLLFSAACVFDFGKMSVILLKS